MSEEIILPIRVDPRDAIDGLGKFEKASRGASDVFIGVLGAEAVKAVIKGVGKAIGEFAGFFADGIESAKRQEKALKDLEIQLGLSGEATQETLDEFVAFSAEIQRNTLIADDAVLGQIALAKSFGLSNTQAKDLVVAATELSAVTGETLETSVKELGKTYAGQQARSVTLRRATEGLTKAQLESGAAIQVVLEQFGGAAAARLDTYSGQVARLDDNWANLGEVFGETLVQNPLVVAAFAELADFVEWLAIKVTENQDTMIEWIDFGILAAGTALSVTIDVIRFFADALNGIVTAGALVLTGLGTVVSFLADVWDKTIGNAGRVILSLLETIGILDEGAVDAFDSMTRGIKEAIDEATDAAAEFAFDGMKRADSIAKTYSKVSDAVDESVVRIISSERKQVGSINSLAVARNTASENAERGAADLAKGIEAAAKLEAEIYKDLETDIQKAVRVRAEFQDKIAEQLANGNIDKQKAADLELQIESDLIEKLEKIRSDADKLALEEQQKFYDDQIAMAEEAADKARERVESAASDPIKFLIEADSLSATDIAPLTVGFATSILEGAAGAEKLIAEGVGALADTFLPGIGGAVSTLVTQLARGPEENKKFVREFVEAVPEIVDAIAESIPVVVEALVDSLINEGGIVRIAVALAKAFSGEAILKSIGKQIGLEFGDAFNLANIGRTITDGIRTGMTFLGTFIGQIPSKIGEGAKILFKNMVEGGKKIAEPLLKFVETFRTFTSNIGDTLGSIFGGLANVFSFDFDGFTSSLKSAFSTGFKALTDPIKPFLNGFINILNALKLDRVDVGGRVLGKNFSFTLIPDIDLIPGEIPKFAKGITSIPAGFPDDTFDAKLSSFERVVSAPQNRDLSAFLSDYNRGTLQGEADNGGFDPEALDILKSIAIALESGRGQDIVVKIDKREIARAQVSNNQLNARTA